MLIVAPVTALYAGLCALLSLTLATLRRDRVELASNRDACGGRHRGFRAHAVGLTPGFIHGASGEQIQHRVQATVIDGVSRLFLHDRLGPKCDTDIGLRQHRQIVGTVADRNDEPTATG